LVRLASNCKEDKTLHQSAIYDPQRERIIKQKVQGEEKREKEEEEEEEAEKRRARPITSSSPNRPRSFTRILT
jgi:hypothetical protein